MLKFPDVSFAEALDDLIFHDESNATRCVYDFPVPIEVLVTRFAWAAGICESAVDLIEAIRVDVTEDFKTAHALLSTPSAFARFCAEDDLTIYELSILQESEEWGETVAAKCDRVMSWPDDVRH